MKALLLLACLPLAFLSCKRPIPEPSLGEVAAIPYPAEPAPVTATCLAQIPQDCNLIVAALQRGGFKSTFDAKPLADGSDVTYHNDGFGGSDGSVRLDLRDAMLADNKQNVFYQHTHGKAHTLYVMSKVRRDGVCKNELRAYPLQTGDEVRVFHGPKDQPMPWVQILDGSLTPDVKVNRVMRSDKTVPGCNDADHPTPAMFFEIDAPSMSAQGQLIDNPSITQKPQPASAKLLRFETNKPTVLRRIVISNNNVPKHYIKLNGCSAYKICNRVEGQPCDNVPLCRLSQAELEHCNCDPQ